MQFADLLTRRPHRSKSVCFSCLGEDEFEKVRGFYTDGLVQIWLRCETG